jgi:hypothetical protein
MGTTHKKLPVAAVFVAIFAASFVAGCHTSAPSTAAPLDGLPAQASPSTAIPPTHAAVTETPVSTATLIPATPKATSTTFTPTATYPPEIVATRPEDIVGVWRVKTFVGQGGQVKFPANLTFRGDGSASFDETDDPIHIFGGIVHFADGTATIESDECYNEVKAVFYHCTMTFVIYSTIVDGKPVRIRLVSTGDKGVFITNVNNKFLFLYEP